jgi:ATP dependent DNA ligase domain
MLASDALAAATTWRPQEFGARRAADVPDPLVEPLWTGIRLLSFVHDGQVSFTDVFGEPIEGHDDVRAELSAAAAGATVLLEAVLTTEPLQSPIDMAGREQVKTPKASRALGAMVVGDRGDRKDRLAEQVDDAQRRMVDNPFVPVALVAVDLLWLDDQSLCDVPLLERRRILESVLNESHLVRVGIFVKPPIDAWLGAWRTFGFSRMAFKGANSRYIPGSKNRDWGIAQIPRR